MERGKSYSHCVVEAICLAALVVLPIHFNPYSLRMFEVAKSSLFLALAAALLVAWLLHGADRLAGRVPGKRNPLSLPVGLYLLAFAVATLLSIHLRDSFWGSYARLQGLVTQLGYVALFFCVSMIARQRQSRHRLLAVVLTISVPIAVYGILQHLGMEPLPWRRDLAQRVTSTMGGPIFLAGYLSMLVPLTLHVTFAAWGFRSEWGLAKSLLAAGCGVGAIGVQLAAVYQSGSRGPVLALLAGLTVYGLLAVVCHPGRRRARVALLGVGVVSVTLLAAALWPVITGGKGHIPALGRFAHLLDPAHTTSSARLVLWDESARMFTAETPLLTEGERSDTKHALRWLIGYGPETARLVYPQRMSIEMARDQEREGLADRAHNNTWDSVLSGGVLGLLSFLVLFQAVMTLGFLRLGLLVERRDILVLNAWAVGGAVLAALASRISGHPGLLGVGIPVGLLAGSLAALVMRPRRLPPATWSIHAALCAAIATHFVEIQFAFPVMSTRLLFWTFAGILAGAVHLPSADIGAETTPAQAGLSWGILAALAGVTMGYSLLLPGVAPLSAGLFLSLGGTLVVLVGGLASEPRSVRTRRCVALALAAVGAGGVVFVGWRAHQLGVLSDAADALAGNRAVERYLTGYIFFTACCIVVVSTLRFERWRKDRSPVAGVRAVLVILLSLPLAHATAIPSCLSGIPFLEAERQQARGNWPDAEALYRRAIELEPHEDQYYRRLANRYYKQATISRETRLRDAAIKEAIDLELQAVECSPLKAEGMINLGRMYRWWASVATEESQLTDRATLAGMYFDQAMKLDPARPGAWCHHAVLQMTVLSSPQTALQYLETAVEMAPEAAWPRQLLGHCFGALISKTRDQAQMQYCFEQALHHFQKSFEYERAGDPNSYAAHLAAGELYAMAGKTDDAAGHLLQAARLGPVSSRKDLTVRARRIQLGYDLPSRRITPAKESEHP